MLSCMNPQDYPQIFGQHFAASANRPIVQVGHRSYTRYDLGRMGCPHIHAARALDTILKQLGVSSLEDLVKHYSPEHFVGIKGFGITTFYVLTCILTDARFRLKDFYTAKTTVLSLQSKVRKQEQARTGRRRVS